MTEEKKNKLFYKFMAWAFGILVLISMAFNFLQIIHTQYPNPSTRHVLAGMFVYFVLTAFILILIPGVLTQIYVFFVWLFRRIVARNINWIKKEFGLSPDEKH